MIFIFNMHIIFVKFHSLIYNSSYHVAHIIIITNQPKCFLFVRAHLVKYKEQLYHVFNHLLQLELHDLLPTIIIFAFCTMNNLQTFALFEFDISSEITTL